jgi:biopolymer transport protein ExbD
MRIRRLHKTPAHLEVTAFINLIVVLVPFLLSIAVFTRLAVLDLTLPAKSAAVEQLSVDDLKLEIVIRPDALDVGDKNGGFILHIPSKPEGYDLVALRELMQAIKVKFPNTTGASVLAEPETPYDTLVQVMDAVRVGHLPEGDKVVRAELFPDISIGDAPVITR